MDVAARIFEFDERLLGPIPIAPTTWEVRVGTLPNGRPSKHSNEYFEFCMFECVAHNSIYRKNDLIHQVMRLIIDSMISSTSRSRGRGGSGSGGRGGRVGGRGRGGKAEGGYGTARRRFLLILARLTGTRVKTGIVCRHSLHAS